ncbi:hypothetical protein NITHO_6190005 [Nitrolancea hollandica Lb]|uniref:Uncharacterized protein n=1 Tax=Nitrolancea hollandica Lb TaxID=1129897 RepID=I4EML8_9BACT|nr:hypothetical protein NITHO_6190005 [Nitrolancea hollandica Lb]
MADEPSVARVTWIPPSNTIDAIMRQRTGRDSTQRSRTNPSSVALGKGFGRRLLLSITCVFLMNDRADRFVAHSELGGERSERATSGVT